MQTYKTPAGFKIQVLSKQEQNKIWADICTDISPIGKNVPQYVPNHNEMEYFIVSTTEVANFKYETVLKIQGKKYTCKHNDCNQDEKMYSLIRKVYGLDKK